MKLFRMFQESAKEFQNLRSVLVTGMLIAVSYVLESFTIDLGFAKINFAFLAIAAIGALYGPTISLFAGGICDLVGFVAHPDGAFFPLYTLIAMIQGLIYGLIAYRKFRLTTPKSTVSRVLDLEICIRLVIARIFDVVVINIICNTAANFHYNFGVNGRTLGAMITVRIVKNLLELPIDVLLIVFVLMPVLIAYEIVFGKQKAAV